MQHFTLLFVSCSVSTIHFPLRPNHGYRHGPKKQKLVPNMGLWIGYHVAATCVRVLRLH